VVELAAAAAAPDKSALAPASARARRTVWVEHAVTTVALEPAEAAPPERPAMQPVSAAARPTALVAAAVTMAAAARVELAPRQKSARSANA
jgi:hypothetical protein